MGINHTLKCSRFYLLPEWQCPLPHWDNSGNCFLIPPIVVLVSGFLSPGKIKLCKWVHVNGMECYQDALFPLSLLPSRPAQVISAGTPIQRPGASFPAVCSSKKFLLHRRFPSVHTPVFSNVLWRVSFIHVRVVLKWWVQRTFLEAILASHLSRLGQASLVGCLPTII